MISAWEGTAADGESLLSMEKPPADKVFQAPTVTEFWNDLGIVMEVICSGPCKSFCYMRLKLLEAKFQLHVLLNEPLEISQQKGVPHRDFYNVRKIDNHVHHSACMNQKVKPNVGEAITTEIALNRGR